MEVQYKLGAEAVSDSKQIFVDMLHLCTDVQKTGGNLTLDQINNLICMQHALVTLLGDGEALRSNNQLGIEHGGFYENFYAPLVKLKGKAKMLT